VAATGGWQVIAMVEDCPGNTDTVPGVESENHDDDKVLG